MPGRDPGTGHDRGGRRQAERARTGNHENRHRIEKRLLPVPRRKAPAAERRYCDDQHHGHEHRAHAIHELLDRRLLRLGALHEIDDAGKHGLGAYRGDGHCDRAFAVHRATGHLVARPFRDRQRFSSEHRFIGVRAPFENLAVHWNALARAYDHDFARGDPLHRDLDLRSRPPHPRRFRAQRLQRANGLRRLALCAPLQPFAEQDERNHRCAGFEVEVRHAVARVRNEQVERKAVSRARTEGDEQVHVAAARDNRLPARPVKPRAQYELDRRGKRKLKPGGKRPLRVDEAAEHREHQRCGENRR